MLITEDGTGLPDANGYCTTAFADSYFSDRANTAWTGSDADKGAWIILATDYIEQRFSRRFMGCKLTDTQSLSFPRSNYDGRGSEGMPVNLLKACAEYALRAKAGPLAPDPVTDASGRVVIGSKKKVGPIETETQFQAGTSVVGIFKSYPAADMLLAGLLMSRGGVYR